MAKTLKEAWESKWDILTGIWNDLFTSSEIKEMSNKRMDICNSCPEIDKKGDKCFAPGTQPCCGICGCKLKWKTKVPSEECDLGKWKKEKL